MGALEWAVMGSRARTIMGLESHSVSGRVTKHFVTIFSKTYNNILLNRSVA